MPRRQVAPPVPAWRRRRTSSTPVKEVDDGDEGGAAADGLLAPAVDGQLRVLSQVGPLERLDALECHEAVARLRRDLRQHRLDPLALVDRGRDHREVLGQRQQALAAEVVLYA